MLYGSNPLEEKDSHKIVDVPRNVRVFHPGITPGCGYVDNLRHRVYCFLMNDDLRPTYIYWLFDTRPETIAAGHPNGRPFYCGKTLEPPEERLKQHIKTAKKVPHRLASRVILNCGEHISVATVAVVPAGGDWAAAERNWIRTLESAHPTANTRDVTTKNPGHTWPFVKPPREQIDRRKHAEKRLKRLAAIEKHNEEKRRYMDSLERQPHRFLITTAARAVDLLTHPQLCDYESTVRTRRV